MMGRGREPLSFLYPFKNSRECSEGLIKK